MTDLFADTSGWGHLVDPTQAYHSLAATLYRTARQQRRKVITTNYIIAELVALMSSPLHIPRPRAIAFIEALKSSPHVEIIHIDTTMDKLRGNYSKTDKTRNGVSWTALVLSSCASVALLKLWLPIVILSKRDLYVY